MAQVLVAMFLPTFVCSPFEVFQRICAVILFGTWSLVGTSIMKLFFKPNF